MESGADKRERFAERLRRAGIRPTAVAIGVNPSRVAGWTNGERPDIEVLPKLARHLGLPLAELGYLAGYPREVFASLPDETQRRDPSLWRVAWGGQIDQARRENRAGHPREARNILRAINASMTALIDSTPPGQRDEILFPRFEALGELVQIHNDIAPRSELEKLADPLLLLMEGIIDQLEDLGSDTRLQTIRLLAIRGDMSHLLPDALAVAHQDVLEGLALLKEVQGRLPRDFVKTAEILHRQNLLAVGAKASQGLAVAEYEGARKAALRFLDAHFDDGLPGSDAADLYEGLARAAGSYAAAGRKELARQARRFVLAGKDLVEQPSTGDGQDVGVYLRVDLSLRQTEILLAQLEVLDLSAGEIRQKYVSAYTLAVACGALRSQVELKEQARRRGVALSDGGATS